MNQSLFSAHCFVCILHGSVWTHAEAESSTLHRLHTSTQYTLHTSTLTVALSCSARKCELSSLVALPQKIIKLESFQKGWQCCKNVFGYHHFLLLIKLWVCHQNRGNEAQWSVENSICCPFSGRLYGSSHYLYHAKKVTQTRCHFGPKIPYTTQSQML